MGNAMKRIQKRTLKRGAASDELISIKGGVVPSDADIQFHAYRVPGRAFSARFVESTRQWVREVNRVLTTGSVARPKIVLENAAFRTNDTGRSIEP
jgi:hypothetical protein